MLTGPRNKLFGSRRRTEVLTLVGLLDETYPSELARLLKAPLFSVQKIVDSLDREGVVSTRVIGRERRVALNPRYMAHGELRELLLRLAASEPALGDLAAKVRRRPRRRGKSL
jgi:hypothetical protein